MNARNYIVALAYFTDLNTSSLSKFLDLFDDSIKSVKPNQKEVVNFLTKKIKELRPKDKPTNQKSALNFLLVKDLELLLSVAKKKEFKDPEETLVNNNDFFIKELKKLGLKTVSYKLEIVDRFPSVWAKHGDKYSAVGLGPGYQKFYNIEPGIYIHRRNLTPVYTDGMLLPHEIMHHVINFYSDTEFGRGLEEGLCDLLGMGYLGSKKVGWMPPRKRFVYSFYNHDRPESVTEYFIFSKQATYLYLNYGLDGMVALVKGGRKKIREVEQYLSAGEFEKIKLPKGHWDKQFTSLVNYITLAYTPHFIVSPLARYMADFIKAGDSLELLRKKLGIDKKDFAKAINELDDKVDLIQCYKGEVNYSVLSYPLNANSLRYKIGKNKQSKLL